MRSFEESMTALTAVMGQVGQAAAPRSAFYIGEVLEGGERLRVSCGGLQLEREDMWINEALTAGYSPKLTGTLHGQCGHCGDVPVPVTEDRLTRSRMGLKAGDRVVLLSTDGQEFYLLCKAVRAG